MVLHTYSKLIAAMYTKRVKLNRKVLSNLAISNANVFSSIVNYVK